MSKSKEEMVSDLVKAFLDSLSSADAEQYIRFCETKEWNKLSTEAVRSEWNEICGGDK